jgi:hypothetical protein
MKKLMLIACLALLVAPAAALADNPSPGAFQAAQKACAAQRTAMTLATFKATYGANAYGKCVSTWAHRVQQNTSAASASCHAQQADANFATSHGGKTFDQFYGTGKHGKNALGNCVSSATQAATAAQSAATVNAARACRGEQKADAAGFAAHYGTGTAKTNAFGRCVSQKTKALQHP